MKDEYTFVTLDDDAVTTGEYIFIDTDDALGTEIDFVQIDDAYSDGGMVDDSSGFIVLDDIDMSDGMDIALSMSEADISIIL